MGDNKRLWDPWQMYDVTPEEHRAMKERAKMKQALKAEWMKKFTNPFKGASDGSYLHDPAVQRFISLKATQAEHFKGTFRSAAWAFAIFVLPVSIITHLAIKNQEERERKYRNGEVMYKDREDRFFY